MKTHLLLITLLSTVTTIQIQPFSYTSLQKTAMQDNKVITDYFKPITIAGVEYQTTIKPGLNQGKMDLLVTFIRNSDFSIALETFIPDTEVFCGKHLCSYSYSIWQNQINLFWCRKSDKFIIFDRIVVETDLSFTRLETYTNAIWYSQTTRNMHIYQIWPSNSKLNFNFLFCTVFANDQESPDECSLVRIEYFTIKNRISSQRRIYRLRQFHRLDPRKHYYSPILSLFTLIPQSNMVAVARLDKTTQTIYIKAFSEQYNVPEGLNTGCNDLKTFAMGSKAKYHVLAYSCQMKLSLVLYAFVGIDLILLSETKIQQPFPSNFLLYNVNLEVEANRVGAYVGTSNYLLVNSFDLTSPEYRTEYRNYFDVLGSVHILSNHSYPSAKVLLSLNHNGFRQIVTLEKNDSCLWLRDGNGEECTKSCKDGVCNPCENNRIIDRNSDCHDICPVAKLQATWYKFCDDELNFDWGPANDNCDCSSVEFCDANACLSTCSRERPYYDHNRYCSACESPFEFYNYVINECVSQCPDLFPLVDADNICIPCPSSSPYYRPDTNECVSECPGTLPFSDRDTCKLCPSDRKYYDRLTNSCLAKCPSEKPFSDENHICESCGDLFYSLDRNKCLETCPNSEPNSNDMRICFKCRGNLPFFHNGGCVSSCPNEKPFSDENGICSKCPSTAPFYVEASNNCESRCPASFPLYDSEFVCKECEDGYFSDSETNQCLKECLPFRPFYDENKVCKGCATDKPFYVKEDNNCLEKCPNNYPLRDEFNNCFSCQGYYDSVTNRCLAQCSEHSPLADSDRFCLACSPITPFYDSRNNICLEKCPESLPFSNSFNICQPCGGTTPVYDSIQRKCSQACQETEPNTLNGICIDKCPEGFVSDNEKCVIVCPPERKYIHQSKCQSFCPEEAPFYDKNNKCLSNCPSGSFPEALTKACLEECPNSQKQANNQCVSKCPETAPYETNTALCLSECNQDFPLLVEEFKKCYAKDCPDSHPYVIDSQCLRSHDNRLVDCSNRIVSLCPDSARLTLEYSLDVELNPCKALNPYKFNRCVSECPVGTKIGEDNNCILACNFKEGFVLLNNNCVNCKELSDLLPFAHQNKCVKECPPSFYADAFNSCIFCDESKGEKVLNQNCVEDCPLGYIYEEYSNICTKINDNCENDQYSFEGGCYQTCPEDTITNPDQLNCTKIPSECLSDWCINGECQSKQANAHFPTCSCEKGFYGIRCSSTNYELTLEEYQKRLIYSKTTLKFMNEFAETLKNGDFRLITSNNTTLQIFINHSAEILHSSKEIKEKLQILESRQKVFMFVSK